MCGTGPEQKEAVTVALPYSMVSDDSFPNLVVLTYACVEVTEEYELVRLWNSRDNGFQFFIELFLDFVWVGHGWSVGADKGSGSLPAKGELEFHKAIVQPFWDVIELLDKMVFDGKAYTCLMSLVTAVATPEEGVSAANLGEPAFARDVCFVEGCDVDSVAHASSLAARAVHRSGFPDVEVVESRRVLTLHDAKVSFITFFMFRPHEWETRQPR